MEASQAANAGRVPPKQSFDEVLKKTPEAIKAAPKPTPPPLPKSAQILGVKAIQSPATTTAPVAGPKPGAAAQRPQGALTGMQALATARMQMNAKSAQLTETRTHALTAQEQKVDTRLLELIVKELSIEFTSEERGAQPTAADPGASKRVGAVEPATLNGGSNGARTGDGFGQIAQKLEVAQTQASAKAQAAMAVVEKIEAFVKAQRPALALTVNGAINARVEVERTGPNEVALKVSGTRGPPPPEDVARIREAVRAKGLKLSSLSIG